MAEHEPAHPVWRYAFFGLLTMMTAGGVCIAQHMIDRLEIIEGKTAQIWTTRSTVIERLDACEESLEKLEEEH